MTEELQYGATRRLTRREQQERTREGLIKAAETLILDQSIPGLSIRAVCAHAGYSQGAFYSNFSRKEDLLLEVMKRRLDEDRSALVERLAQENPVTFDKAKDTIVAWLRDMSNQRELAQLSLELRLQAERDAEFKQRFDAFDAQVTGELVEVLDGIIERYNLSPVLPSQLIVTTLRAFWHATAIWDDALSGTEIGRTMFMNMLHGLLMPNSEASMVADIA